MYLKYFNQSESLLQYIFIHHEASISKTFQESYNNVDICISNGNFLPKKSKYN